MVFCTEDLQLIKGAARSRRRFLDLLLAQTHPVYLPLLQRYAKALRSRNALLKQRTLDEAALESFTRELVQIGNQLIKFRQDLLPKISPLARLAYRRISVDAEELRLVYQPAVKNDFAVELAQSRARERSFRSTLIGPHRDELQLLLDEKSAAKFASEGQKRSLAIALKMAQAEYLCGIHGSPRFSDRRCHGRTGRKTSCGVFAVVQPHPTSAEPGFHDLHRRKLATRTE